MLHSQSSPELLLTRFELVRVLGTGGVGVVYEAYDRLENTRVALKTLQQMTPAGLYYFKQEFRALADVSHPNLISLFELWQADPVWFFTMEMLEGQSFLRYVREPLTCDEHAPTRSIEPTAALTDQEDVAGEDRSLAQEATLGGLEPQAAPQSPRSYSKTLEIQGEWLHELESPSAPDRSAEPEDLTRTLTFASLPALGLEALQDALPDPMPQPAEPRGMTPALHLQTPAQDLRAAERLNLEKLRDALRQLVSAISRVHAAGKLHRDLKSSNVLVTAEGRLVVLDFGLVQALEQAALGGKSPAEGANGAESRDRSPSESQVGTITGTPAYMAPEAFNGIFSPASDWWAVGVMLYQALTGQLPFQGKLMALIRAVLRCQPVPPSSLNPAVPPELEALCLSLLDRDPARRPQGPQILHMLGARSQSTGEEEVSTLLGSLFSSGLLVGRERQLAQLQAALAAVEHGEARLLRVQGLSGIGKSSLIQHFLASVQAENRGMILAGRCYERETLTYKAFDTILDALQRTLRKLPPSEVRSLLPEDLPYLTRLFPVLERLNEETAPARELQTADPHEIRLRAFQALRTLMLGLTRTRPVLLYIDDLQWGDADSAPLLLELLRPPGAPAVLVIGSYRSDELERSPFLKALKTLTGADSSLLQEDIIQVGPLARDEAQSLVESRLERAGVPPEAVTAAMVQAILEEGQGHPFFLNLLVHRAGASFNRTRSAQMLLDEGETTAARDATRSLGPDSPDNLDGLILEAVGQLPAQPRSLLEAIAVAGRPIPHGILKQVLEVDHLETAGLGLLRSVKLIRSHTGQDQGDEVEMYHDRLRSAVANQLKPQEAGRYHLKLARALEKAGHAEPEWLADHFEAAGATERAYHYCLLSARKAMDSLAFDLAALYFRRALILAPAEQEGRIALRFKLAEALKLASRGREAAAVYLEASEQVSAELAFDCRRQAAELLMRTGFIEEGRALLSSLLQRLGMKFARSPGRALLSYILSALWLKVRGYGLGRYQPDAPETPDRLRAIDLATSISDSMVYSSMADSLDFHGQRIRMALRLGEPSRAIRSLASEHAFLATQGYRARDKVQQVYARATRLLKEHGSPMPAIALHLGYGTALMWMGFNREAREEYRSADRMLLEQPSELLWERGMAKTLHLVCQKFLGEWAEMHGPALELTARFRTLQDRLEEAAVRLRILAFSHLVRGELEDARLQVELGEKAVPKEVSLWSSYILRARVEQLLLERRGAEAWALVEGQWKALEPVLAFEFEQIFGWLTFGQAALGAACQAGPGEQRRALVKQAHRAFKRIEKRKAPHALAQAGLLRAGILVLEGQRPRAVAHLEETEALATTWNYGAVVHLAQARRGALLGGKEGAALQSAGLEGLRARGAQAPERLADALSGWWLDP